MNERFDIPVNRRGSGSLKWDVGENELPMWVADMDFPAAPPIQEALYKRVAHGVFGYSILPDEWWTAYIDWWKKRHDFTMMREWLIFTTGVVPAISTAVRKFTTPAEYILIQTPVYNIFYNSILNNGRRVLESPLRYENGEYSMDFEDLEEKLARPQTTMMILCNPHNPVGKIWDRDTLARVGELCRKHHVLVLSDEIHCDITLPGTGYVPFASASEDCRMNSITCIAPTKAFNLAGLQTAAVCVPHDGLRARMDRALNTDEVAEPNAFAVTAAVAAFTKGAEWLDALNAYLAENRRTAAGFIAEHLPSLHLVTAEATYLLWLDCCRVTDNADELADHLRRTTGLYVSAGAQYGEAGRSFLRINIACPRSTLLDGLDRLKRGVESFR